MSFNSIVKPYFSYRRLVRIFCSRTSNNVINKIDEQALGVVLNK